MTTIDDRENRAVRRIVAHIRLALDGEPLNTILKDSDILDTPNEHWAISRALLTLANEFAELAKK